jgi:hypothetical protein
MYRVYKSLNEARREVKYARGMGREEPERLNPYLELKEYKDRDDIYISFRNINKIGINPSSKYNTPNGIYTYPLKEAWKKFKHNIQEVWVPFAGEHPYIYIIEARSEGIEDLYKYSSLDFDNDVNKLQRFYNGIDIRDKQLTERQQEILDRFNKYYKQHLENGIYYFVSDFLFLSYNSFNTHFLQKFNKDEVIKSIDDKMVEGSDDYWRFKSYIASKGNVDVYYLKREKPKYITLLAEEIINYVKEAEEFQKKKVDFNLLLDKALKDARVKNPGGIMWYFTKLISDEIPGKTPVNWNKIFTQVLGYSYIADKSDQGIIHRSEPTQAVFFNTDSFNVIDVLNQDRSETRKNKVSDKISEILNQETYTGDIDLRGSRVYDLGKLKVVEEGTISLFQSNIRSLKPLVELVKGDLILSKCTQLNNLGDLESVGGNLRLDGCINIKNLGKLNYVYGILDLTDTKITNLDGLDYVGNHIKGFSGDKSKYGSRFRFSY